MEIEVIEPEQPDDVVVLTLSPREALALYALLPSGDNSGEPFDLFLANLNDSLEAACSQYEEFCGDSCVDLTLFVGEHPTDYLNELLG